MAEDGEMALIQTFESQSCFGIANFLRFMLELDTDERREVFASVLLHRLETKTSMQDPFQFFNALHIVRSRALPYIDAGVTLMDQVCAEASYMWESTGRETH
jgi:hypothetical protein